MLTSFKKYRPFISVLTVFFVSIYFIQPALALPTDPDVQNGDVSIDTDGNSMYLTVSDKSIINWGSFSIGINELVQFLQSSSSAVVLNRVIGDSISEILGSLIANGNIFLINENGIVFGASSHVDVNGLLASTLDISNDDFLNDNYVFQNTNPNGVQIINEGDIRAADGGYIIFISDSVDNSGYIQADLGTVWLASGKKTTVSFDKNKLISVVVDEATQEKIDSIVDAIKNTGEIQANSGEVYLTANLMQGLFQNGVNQTGIIRANTLQEDMQGNIYIASTGHIVSTGTLHAKGGDILFTGYNGLDEGGTYSGESIGDFTAIMHLGDQTIGNVNSDGAYTVTDNGTITVNGDITITNGAITLRADNDDSGGGNFTHSSGTISTTVGGQSITISSGSSSATGTGNVLIGNVTPALAQNLTVSAAGGDITSQATTELSGANVTLSALGPIDVALGGHGAVSATTTNTNITLSRTSGNIALSSIDAGSGDVSITTTTSGDILYVDSSVIGNTISLTSAANIGADGSSINLGGHVGGVNADSSAANGNIFLTRDNAPIALGTINAGTGNITVATTTGGNITSDSSTLTGGVISLTSAMGNIGSTDAGGDIRIASATSISADASAGNGNIAITSNAGVDFNVGTIAAGTGTITLRSGDDFIGNIGHSIAGGAISLTTDGATGNVGSDSTAIAFGGNTNIGVNTTSSNGNIFISRAGGNLALGTINAGTGNTTVTTTTSGDITSDSSSLTGGTITLTSAGDVATNAAKMTFAGNAKIDASGGNIYLTRAEGDIALGTITATGDAVITTTTSGDITSNSSAVTANNLTLTSAGNIGTSSAKVNTTATTIVDATASDGNIYINETDGLTVTAASATNGLVDITTAGDTTLTSVTASGTGTNTVNVTVNGSDLTIGTITADDAVTLTSNSGSILDDGSATTKVTAGATSTFTANNTIGSLSDALEVAITGLLNISASGASESVSVNIDGTTSNDTLTLLNTPPGVVIFNGRFLKNLGRFDESDSDLYKNMHSQISDISKEIKADPIPQQGSVLYEEMIDFSKMGKLPALYDFSHSPYLVR